MSKISAYAKLLRIPGIGGLAMPPVVGAITVGVMDIYSLIIIFIIGALASLYGFILNDFADIEVDKLSKELQEKPLVSGEIPRNNAIMISVLCILFAYLFIFILWHGKIIDDFKLAAFLCIFIAGLLGSIYDLYGKKIIGSDFLVAISVAFVFLFGALAFGRPNIMTWSIFILTFNNILHMNAIEGGLKDADHDYKLNVKNIALSSGVKVIGKKITIPSVFKVFSLSIRLFSVILVFVPFLMFGYDYSLMQIILLVIGVILVLYFSIKLLSVKIFERDNIRKLIAIQSFVRYSLIPLMLISIIGLFASFLLIVLPIVWYVMFTSLIGEKLFRPRM